MEWISGLDFALELVQDPSDPRIQYIVEQPGRVRVVQDGTLLPQPFLDISRRVRFVGECGLTGLAFPRDYATSGRFYFHYCLDQGNGDTVIARMHRSTANPLQADPDTELRFEWAPGERSIRQPYETHKGGHLVFGPDDYLYAGIGDGGDVDDVGDPDNNAQNPNSLLGKILRLDVSVEDSDPRGYRIPTDNPFVNAPVPARGEIWAFGLRNPWRFAFDDPKRGGTSGLFIGDVGQDTWEEVNFEPAGTGGRNYGWSAREGAHDFKSGVTLAFLPLTEPIHEYGRDFGRSVTGGRVYRGDHLGVAHRGRYFLADFITGRVRSLGLTYDPSTGEATTTDVVDHSELAALGLIASFDLDAEGEMHLVRWGAGGAVLKIVADADGDLLPDGWETLFGLNPANPADALADTDGDGVTNLDEFRARTHPTAIAGLTRYLAEGATSEFFDTAIAIANPGAQAAQVVLRFLTSDGLVVSRAVGVEAFQRVTVRPADLIGLAGAAFSTIGETNRVVVVERTMTWDRTGYGAHTEKAVSAPATTWYFAEGSQGFFFTYVLLANVQPTVNRARVKYLREGDTPLEREYVIPPNARLTVDAGADPELVGRSFGIVVTFDRPGVAERAMYFGTPPDVLWKGGHESAGVTSPATEWFFAEGATGDFFETFILAANPHPFPVDATFAFLTEGGPAITRTKTIPANGRITVNVELEDPALAHAAVATRVTAPQGIVAERAQYWPFAPSSWLDAHNSFGASEAATRLALAEGETGGARRATSYLLFANASSTDATVRVTFLREQRPPVATTIVVPANRRVTVSPGPGSVVPDLQDERFGALVESSVPIAVERSMYFDANGQFWSAGSSASATPIP